MAETSERFEMYRVVSTRQVADEIVHARLEGAQGEALPGWQPGAHIEIRLPSGLIRHYSLCGDPTDTTGYDIAVLREREGRGGSQEFHREVSAGSELGVAVPRNDFVLKHAKDYVFFAGGVGITPILPMVRQAIATGAQWKLVYAGRCRTSMAFLDEVLAMDQERVVIHAEDENGRPDFSAELSDVGAEALIYTCGPPPMLDALVAIHAQDAVPAALHLERFSGTPAGETSGTEFEVVAKRSGVSVTIGAADSILAALRPFVSHLPFSCEEGYCGTCETDVIEGTPDHRDTYLDDDERDSGDTIMICVSRCVGSKIVLDI